MITLLISFVQILSRLMLFVVIVDVVLSYFLPPYHNVRLTLDRLVEPLLLPIRRILPTAGGFDFSPLVLIILIQIVEAVLISLLASLG